MDKPINHDISEKGNDPNVLWIFGSFGSWIGSVILCSKSFELTFLDSVICFNIFAEFSNIVLRPRAVQHQ
jgi:hypothetical protein